MNNISDCLKTLKGKANASIIIFCVFLCSLVLMTPAYAKASKVQNIQGVLQQLIAQYNIPGAVLSYKIGNQKIKTIAVGYASLSPKIHMTDQSLFLVGSITKSFTSTMILRLVEKGDISLNETLASVAQAYPGQIRQLVLQYPPLALMTIKELLNHTSGVPQSINTSLFKSQFNQNPKKYYPPKKLIEIAMQHPVYFKPGTKGDWSYTNTDYILLGLIIEDVTKKPLNVDFKKLVSTANLKDVYFANKGIVPLKAAHKLTLGYISTDSSNAVAGAFLNNKVVVVPGVQHTSAYQLNDSYNIFSPAASGVIATAPALVQWYQVLFQKDLLTAKSREALLTPVPNGKYNHAGYALGVTIHTYPGLGYVISHDGLQPGYSSIVMFFKKYNLILAVTTNSSNERVSTFNVYNGKILPGIVTKILPYIINGSGDD